MDKFDINLPRSTEFQAKIGSRISRRELAPGDLVFFRTGVFSKHVGIHVEKGIFLHVSKEKGVTLSSLEDNYWSKKYWQSRRLKSELL
jgi:cell wall-associated NlpC family hydrolase